MTGGPPLLPEFTGASIRIVLGIAKFAFGFGKGNGSFGLTEAISIAPGGMIGGGILCSSRCCYSNRGRFDVVCLPSSGHNRDRRGYSYIGLNTLVTDKEGENGGRSVTFVRAFTGNSSLAGTVGWTLLVGYSESMAMYAFAFGEFALALPFVPESLGGLPLRPAVSVSVAVGFVGLNPLRAPSRSKKSVPVAIVMTKLSFAASD